MTAEWFHQETLLMFFNWKCMSQWTKNKNVRIINGLTQFFYGDLCLFAVCNGRSLGHPKPTFSESLFFEVTLHGTRKSARHTFLSCGTPIDWCVCLLLWHTSVGERRAQHQRPLRWEQQRRGGVAAFSTPLQCSSSSRVKMETSGSGIGAKMHQLDGVRRSCQTLLPKVFAHSEGSQTWRMRLTRALEN
jgi:hypothetical protein